MSRQLLKNLRIFESEKGDFSSEQDLLVEDGVIKMMGPLSADGQELSQFNADDVTDYQGKYAVPGLWECHGHLTDLSVDTDRGRKRSLSYVDKFPDDESLEAVWNDHLQERLQEFLDNGVTHVRDVGGPLKNIWKLKQSIVKGRFKGPDIRFAGPMLERLPLHWAAKNKRFPGFTVSVSSKERVDKVISTLKSAGASLVKTFNKFDREIFSYLVKTAGEHQLPVTHDPGAALYQEVPISFAIEQGVRCFEHAQGVVASILSDTWAERHEKLIHSPMESKENRMFMGEMIRSVDKSIDWNKLDELCQRMVEMDAYLCPTLWTLQSLRTQFDSDAPTEQEARRREFNKAFCDLVQRIIETLAANNVKMFVGHDSSSPTGTLTEMELMVEWGVPAADVIKGATFYPAAWFGVNDQYGEICPGKEADLVILDKNPLESISNIRSV